MGFSYMPLTNAGASFENFGSSSNLSYQVGSYVEFTNQGFNTIGFNLTIPSGATIQFQGSFDGQNYSAIRIRRVANDGYVNSTTVSDNYIGSISSLRKFRAIVTASGGTIGSLIGRASMEVSTLEGIENGPPNDFALNLAERKISGYRLINKFGSNPDIDTATTPEDIWYSGGLYPGFPTTGGAQKLSIWSTSSSDTVLGSGARTLYVEGLNGDFVEQSETIALSGILPVRTALQYRRCNRAYVLTAGVSEGTVGIISIANQSGVAFATVNPSKNQALIAAYTIPSGTTGYLIKLYSSLRRFSGAAFDRDANLELLTREPGGVFRSRRDNGITTGYHLESIVYGGLRLPEMTDVVMRVSSVSENNSDVAGGFDIILVDN